MVGSATGLTPVSQVDDSVESITMKQSHMEATIVVVC